MELHNTATPTIQAQIIQICLKLLANASLTTICFLLFVISRTRFTFAAALSPVSAIVRFVLRPASKNSCDRPAIPFWNIVPPMMTDRHVDKFRTNPIVLVEVAVSRCFTCACNANSGGVNSSPIPSPAII